MIDFKIYSRQLAKSSLEIGALKIDFKNPFEWASCYRMPIYYDATLFLSKPLIRDIVTLGFKQIIEQEGIPYDFIAGISTGGIPPATSLADKLGCPLVYIRTKPKDYGLKNRIEGVGSDLGLEKRRAIVIEDTISTGKSSADAVKAIRGADGFANYLLSVFDYTLAKSELVFSFLDPKCEVRSLLTYDTLLNVAEEMGYVKTEQLMLLEQWRADPLWWGEKHGFPRLKDKK